MATIGQGPCAGPRGTPLVQLGYTPRELSVLVIARHYFKTFADPDGQHWMTALTAACDIFGTIDGPRASAAVLVAIQAMRQARRSVFRFNAPDCATCSAHVSDHERLLLGALQAVARGDRGTPQAVLLVECNPAGPFEAALAHAAHVCDSALRAEAA